jgi:hypothetical protein
VDVEITPEPSEEERQAILAALALEQASQAGATRRWQAGLEDEEDEGGSSRFR